VRVAVIGSGVLAHYFAFCEPAFRIRSLFDMQIVLEKS
jgi:hypothetical protein